MFQEPPKRAGPVKELTLTGMLMPWSDGQPVLINMIGANPLVLYLPLFDDPEQLREVLARAEIPYQSIKQVEDGMDFLDSIPVDIIVATSLWFTDEGRLRFHQVQR